MYLHGEGTRRQRKMSSFSMRPPLQNHLSHYSSPTGLAGASPRTTLPSGFSAGEERQFFAVRSIHSL